MTTATRAAPPPARPTGNGAARPAKTFGRKRGICRDANRVLLYGTGGIGKSTLASMAPAPIVCDLDRGTADFDIERVDGVETWADLLAWLQSGDFDGIRSIVLDTVTAAEELCRRHVVETVTTDKGQKVTSLEGFGWGKGYTHLFEEWRRLLGALERHYTLGRNIVLVAHERIAKVPNPSGDDYIRYEPRLHNADRASLMLSTKEWCDHVLFVSYDVVASDGKAKGSGTRTIYTAETATYMAKSRTLGTDPIVYERGSNDLWKKLGGKPAVDDIPA